MEGAAADENRKGFVADGSESPLKVYFAKDGAFMISEFNSLGRQPL